jgi:hypothetical protein
MAMTEFEEQVLVILRDILRALLSIEGAIKTIATSTTSSFWVRNVNTLGFFGALFGLCFWDIGYCALS